MAISRYRNTAVIDKRHYSSSEYPDKSKFDAVPVFKLRVSAFDRLDNLAFKHLGAGEYWWIIAVMNDLDWAFGFEEGQILKIPINVQDVLKLF